MSKFIVGLVGLVYAISVQAQDSGNSQTELDCGKDLKYYVSYRMTGSNGWFTDNYAWQCSSAPYDTESNIRALIKSIENFELRANGRTGFVVIHSIVPLKNERPNVSNLEQRCGKDESCVNRAKVEDKLKQVKLLEEAGQRDLAWQLRNEAAQLLKVEIEKERAEQTKQARARQQGLYIEPTLCYHAGFGLMNFSNCKD